MPFTFAYPDTVYRPQFDVTPTVTVTQPYREEKCIFIFKMASSAPTSGLSKGYCYYNTSSWKICIYDGTDFIEMDPHVRSDGYVYWIDSNRAFYEYNGTHMVALSFSAEYNHVYLHTLSLTVQPSSAEIGDWYYNASGKTLYVYLGYEVWRAFSYDYTLNRYMFAFDSRLWYYHSIYKAFYPQYEMVQFGIAMESQWVYRQFVSASVTFPYTFTYPGTDVQRRYTMRAIWMDKSGNARQLPEVGMAYEEGYTEYIQGRWGTISTSFAWYSPLQTYPTTDDEFTTYLACTPDATNHASILAPRDFTGLQFSEQFGVTYRITKIGGKGGTFASLTLSEAVSAGFLTLTTTRSASQYNQSWLSFRLKYSGRYILVAEYSYRSAPGVGSPQTGSRSLSWNVYAASSPKLEISSNPAPSPDPEIYPPPYTVVLHDASSSEDPYQIPQKSVTLDAGDSADPESWTLENTGTSFITMPDKTHIYNGYGPYRPSLTFVDMNGNTAVGYAQFAPNKEGRIYADPKIVYDGVDYAPGSAIAGGEAPILLECHAYVAGSPAPEVKWSFALNPSSEYYTGEKIGEFTELSLLAGGSYDIHCKITSGNEVLGEYAWTASASAVYHADTPVALQDFVIWIYDASGNRVDRIVPANAQYVDRFAHASYCEFALPIDYAHMNCLTPGCELAFGYLGKARLMIVTGFAEDDAGEFVTITAKDAASVALESRVATVATRSTSGNGYDVQTCSAEALLRYFAVANARTGNRKIARMRVVDACQDRGGRTTYSARYETVVSIFEDICTDSGLGWDSSLQTTSGTFFSMKVVAGADRTYGTSPTSIIFEDRKNGRGSATLGSFSGFLPSNLAIAAGKGNGSSREYKEFGEIAATGLERREVFVDAGESADELEMQREAEAELKKQDEKSIMVYPNENVYTFGVDYHVGDYVTVVSKSGIMLHLQIIQANYSLDATGKTLSLECGSDLRDYQKLIRETKLANAYARK